VADPGDVDARPARTSDPRPDARALAAVLAASDQGAHTCPSPDTYPHQWAWDSCLTALGWATLDPARGYAEIESLLGAALPGGMVPHIAYTPARDGYMPGPEWWGRTGADGRAVSGITQPPLAGTCLALISARHPDPARARRLLEPAAAWHRALARERGADTGGEPVLVHPWESGRDDAPEWDAPLAAAPVPGRAYVRRDTDRIPGAERPTDADYRAYMGLVEWLGAHRDEPERARTGPFRVLDPAFSGILARSAHDLAGLAERLGERALAAEQRAIADRVDAAVARRSGPGGLAPVLDLVTGRPAALPGAGLALQALRPAVPMAAIRRIARRCTTGDLASPVGVRSLAAGVPGAEPRRYWRGPVWAPVTWLAALGLERADPAAAAGLRARLLAGVARHGAYEYLSPDGEERLGARTLAWTAALALWELGRASATPAGRTRRPGAPRPPRGAGPPR
jgi:hypothetical protein